MRWIISFIASVLPYMLIVLPQVVLWRAVRIRMLKKAGQKTNWRHECGVCVFFLFLAGLASLTILPGPGGRFTGIIDPGSVSLTPLEVFSPFREGFHAYSFTVLLGNIVMFMPIGFCVPLLWDVTLPKTVLLGLCASLLIELCQLPLTRVTDIDDVWLNTLGGLLGCLVFWGFRRLAPQTAQSFKVGRGGG